MKEKQMSSIIEHKKDWDFLGSFDPLWAILTSADGKYNKWNINDFFMTGEKEITHIIKHCNQHGYLIEKKVALDFGCGVGRLTRSLAPHFQKVHGVDISESMIVKAKELNRVLNNCIFSLNVTSDLTLFNNDYFDFIYSNIVLQHLPNKTLILSYISEFLRTLKKNGLLIFQLPSYIPFKKRIQPRRRLYFILKKLGVNEKFLYNTLRLFPIRMTSIPESRIINFVKKHKGKVIEVQKDNNAGPNIKSKTYYILKT